MRKASPKTVNTTVIETKERERGRRDRQTGNGNLSDENEAAVIEWTATATAPRVGDHRSDDRINGTQVPHFTLNTFQTKFEWNDPASLLQHTTSLQHYQYPTLPKKLDKQTGRKGD